MRWRLLLLAVFLLLGISLAAFDTASPVLMAPDALAARIPASMDTYAASGTDWANSPRGQGPGLYVGYGDSRAFNLGQTETFLWFDLSNYQGSTVKSAVLKLYLAFATYEAPGQRMTIDAKRVMSSWNEAILTWNNKPGYDRNRVEASATVDTAVGRWIEWPLPKALVQSWVDAPSTNFGIALVDPDASRPGPHIRNFYSLQYSEPNLRPYLDIDYEPTPTPATPPTRTPTRTPTPVSLWLEMANQPSGPVEESDYITYTLRYGNRGQQPLSDVVISGSVLSGANVVPHSGSHGATPFATPDGAQGVTWNVGALAPAAQGDMVFSARVHTRTPAPRPSATPTATATPTPTPSPTSTPTVTPEDEDRRARLDEADPTPTASATAMATATPTPSATATSTPTLTATAARMPDLTRVVSVLAQAEGSATENSRPLAPVRTLAYNVPWQLFMPLLTTAHPSSSKAPFIPRTPRWPGRAARP